MTTELNDENNQTSNEQLKELNQLFAKRYTDEDLEYQQMARRRNSPPIVDDWPGERQNSRTSRFNQNNNRRQHYPNQQQYSNYSSGQQPYRDRSYNRQQYSNYSSDQQWYGDRSYNRQQQQRQHSHPSNDQRWYRDYSDDRRSYRDYSDPHYDSNRNDRYRDRSPHGHHERR